jgi:GxxExxY protein
MLRTILDHETIKIWYTVRMSDELLYKDEVYAIQGAVFEAYKTLGNGYAEEVYQQCLEREFTLRGIPFEAKKELRIFYKGEPIRKTYVPDFWCYGAIIVELKAVKDLTPEHTAQLDNYLHLTKCRLGLLVNFGSYPKATVQRWLHRVERLR